MYHVIVSILYGMRLYYTFSHCSAVIKEPLKRVPSVPELESLLSDQGVCMMASGAPVGGVIKIFFHAREACVADVLFIIIVFETVVILYLDT